MNRTPNSWLSIPEAFLFGFLCLLVVGTGIAGYRKWREANHWQEKVAEQRQKLASF